MFNVNVKKIKCVLVCVCWCAHTMVCVRTSRDNLSFHHVEAWLLLLLLLHGLLQVSCLLSFWCILPSSFPSMNARVTDVHLSSTRKLASSVTFQSRVHSDPFLSGTASRTLPPPDNPFNSVPTKNVVSTDASSSILMSQSLPQSLTSEHYIKDPVFNELLGGTFETLIKASRNTILS